MQSLLKWFFDTRRKRALLIWQQWVENHCFHPDEQSWKSFMSSARQVCGLLRCMYMFCRLLITDEKFGKRKTLFLKWVVELNFYALILHLPIKIGLKKIVKLFGIDIRIIIVICCILEGTTESSIAVEKSPCSTTSAQPTPTASCSTSKPSTSVEATSAKTCASSIIPAKATIYTSGGGKKGLSSVPLPATKGSPLFLIPVEKISPKLVEQFIQQGKGDGMKTRSSDKKKSKKPKQASQVLVLIPSSNPNGSPTIQTLTSAEQLESTGDKKPLLLLPADKVPKSIASQSQTVRRKMVITMVAPSSRAATGTKSKALSAQKSATSTSSTGLWLDLRLEFFLQIDLCTDQHEFSPLQALRWVQVCLNRDLPSFI